jgi:hypothetical protein
MTLPNRAWILPGDGVGIWKAENNGSAEMAGAVEYVPVSELKRLRATFKAIAAAVQDGEPMVIIALQGDTP